MHDLVIRGGFLVDGSGAPGRAADIAVSHGTVRAYVMGERGASNEPATAADIQAMADIVERGLRAGALGFSTSRTPIHRSKSGELVPGTNADADELYGIGEGLRRAGHGVFQFAPDHVDVPTGEWPWMKELARRTGRTVSVNLNQPDSAPDLWRDGLGLLDEARGEGIPNVLPLADQVAVLRDPEVRRALAIEPADGGLFRKVVLDKLGQWWAVADGDID